MTHYQWLTGSASDVYDAVRALGPSARVVRGSRCLTKAALMDELAASLQFPPHFGANWDALNDCLCDPHAGAWLVGILDAGKVLAKAGSDDLSKFVAVLDGAAARSAKAKLPKPFLVVLHEEPRDAAAAQKRWGDAGAR